VLKPEIKFQCENCNKINLTDLTDLVENYVHCGKCEAICEVPRQIGPGVVIDDFVIEKLIGSGGMGEVYKAHQFSLDRKAALKIFKGRYLEDKELAREFIMEARTVAQLNHPNIIAAYKFGSDNGIFFFATDYIEGEDLQSRIKRTKKLKQDLVINVAIDITRAIGYAWNKSKLVHRDIKPDNIMLTSEGVAKLMDLGLSRIEEETEETSEIINGTPHYISPEQILGQPLDIRSDFYSLGATMFQLISGHFPFTGSSDEIIDKHLDKKPQPLSILAPTINEDLANVIEKLLSKKPENRFQDAEALEKELVNIQHNVSNHKNKHSGKADSPKQKITPQMKKVLAGAFILLMLLASIWIISTFINSTSTP
jgi:serine/threonine protein kinase